MTTLGIHSRHHMIITDYARVLRQRPSLRSRNGTNMRRNKRELQKPGIKPRRSCKNGKLCIWRWMWRRKMLNRLSLSAARAHLTDIVYELSFDLLLSTFHKEIYNRILRRMNAFKICLQLIGPSSLSSSASISVEASNVPTRTLTINKHVFNNNRHSHPSPTYSNPLYDLFHETAKAKPSTRASEIQRVVRCSCSDQSRF